MQNTPATQRADAPTLGPRSLAADPVVATPAQAEVLDHLRTMRAPVTAAQLSTERNLHPNTVREHLTALVDLGLVERTRLAPAGRGRPTYGYQVARATRTDATTALVSALVAYLAETEAEPAQLAANLGRSYAAHAPAGDHLTARASRLRRTQVVVEAMRELGFAAESDPAGRIVRLRNCPLLDAARSAPDIVCGFHRGLAQGLADAAGLDPAGVRLTPFAEAGACRLDLTPIKQKTP